MIAPPARDPLAFDALLSSSWALFRRNWIVALPPVIALGIWVCALALLVGVGIATAVAGTGGMQHDPSTPLVGMLVVLYLVALIVGIVVNVWAYAAMFGMANAVWERGTTTLADGNAAFRARVGPFLLALVGLIGVGIAALILAIPTLFLALLALPLFTMYVLPAVVGGGRGGFEAIAESFRLVIRFFLPSLIACLVLYGIMYGISFVATLPILPLEFAVMPGPGETMPHFPPIPLLVLGVTGYAIAIVVSLAYYGFYAIAIVGLYRSLIAQPLPAATPAVPSPPAS
jgi:hypothetical protein